MKSSSRLHMHITSYKGFLMNHRAVPRLNRRLLFFSLFLAYISAGIISVLPGASLLLLAENTHVSLAIAGSSFTLSAFGFIIGVLVAGLFATRLNSKYILMGGLGLMSVASAITPITHSFTVLLIAQLIKGVGFGMVDVSVNTIVTLAYQDTLGETLNNVHSAYGIGALSGPLLLSLSLQMLNEALWAYLVGAVVGFVVIVLLMRQIVPEIPRQKIIQKQQQPSLYQNVFLEPLLWFMVLQIALYVGAELGFGSWIVTVLSQSAVISLALAAPAATAFFLGLTIGRLLGGQVLRRGWLSENQLLYVSILGGFISGIVVAIFPGIIVVSFGASVLVGLFYGPLFPGIMAMASRQFVNNIGIVSSVMLVSTGTAAMVLPALMGILIPVIGLNWVLVFPASCCLLIIVPLMFANQRQRHSLHLPDNDITINEEKSVSSKI
ncbi:MAG: MFS transporter [Ktedonobacteraceae bacterium]